MAKSKHIVPTTKTVKGARLFKGKKWYYHVDTLHKGPGAHVEVYNKVGKHIGTMDPVTGDWISTLGDPTKSIDKLL